MFGTLLWMPSTKAAVNDDKKPGNRSITRWVLGLSVVLAAHFSGFSTEKLADSSGIDSALDLLSGLLQPDLSSEFLSRIAVLSLESVWIGVTGTALALFLGIPLALLGAALPDLQDPPGHAGWRGRGIRLIRTLARWILSFFRSIPEIVWAYLFVRIVGLGPGPAVLAIGITFAGIIGKLYAELLEAVDPAPVMALRASGASQFGALCHGALPQVKNQWIRYGLFRLECGIRSASILGIVGAGGIGGEIDLSLRYFQYDKLATALLAVLAYVVVTEWSSRRLRKLPGSLSLSLLGGLAALGIFSLKVPWSDLFSANALATLWDFFTSFLDPNGDPTFVLDALSRTGETLAMAWAATAIAAMVAFVLAPFNAEIIGIRGALVDPPKMPFLLTLPGRLLSGAIRLSFQISRSLPDLVWALFFVVWVGPGAFAGLLAIAAHTTGVLGRLFAEVYEEAESGPTSALEALGVGPLARWRFGLLPFAAPRLASYALFRFEVNVRMTAMIGFVGAGGLGDALHTAISLFHVRDLATLMLLLFATVTLVDGVGGRIRSRWLPDAKKTR